jgi:hypothetical protein
MKDPVKPLIVILPILTIGLIIAFFLTDKPRKTSEAPLLEPTSSVATDAAEHRPETPKTGPQKDSDSSAPKPKAPEQKFDEGDVAIPVEGNPLEVTLLHYPEFGRISIESYKNGKFTGEPLKSGTKVQIPNPNSPGEKIQFIVP